MAFTVDTHKAKTHLFRLLERVKAGEEITIVKSGKLCVRLVPLEQEARELGFLEGTVPDSFFEPLPNDELEAWG